MDRDALAKALFYAQQNPYAAADAVLAATGGDSGESTESSTTVEPGGTDEEPTEETQG